MHSRACTRSAARSTSGRASTDEIRELVLVARDAGLRVGVRGASSKLGWGMPPAGLDLLLELSRQDRVLEHAAGDLVVRVEPGVRLVALREQLAPARQQLALDPPEPGATVGGVIGANASGPSRAVEQPVSYTHLTLPTKRIV